MKRLLVIIGMLLVASTFAKAQVADCPQGFICITPAAARAALEAGDRVKALEAELKARDDAYDKLKDALNDMRVEFATCSGEKTILKQRAVSDAAMIELLSKLVRPKKIGLVNF